MEDVHRRLRLLAPHRPRRRSGKHKHKESPLANSEFLKSDALSIGFLRSPKSSTCAVALVSVILFCHEDVQYALTVYTCKCAGTPPKKLRKRSTFWVFRSFFQALLFARTLTLTLTLTGVLPSRRSVAFHRNARPHPSSGQGARGKSRCNNSGRAALGSKTLQ